MTIRDLARKGRSATVTANAAATRARRERLAEDFRGRLLAELGGPPGTVLQDALIMAATSSYVEMVELSATFNRGQASARQLTRLGLVRGQLTRTLRALGLGTSAQETSGADSSEGRAPDPGDVDALINRYAPKLEASDG